MNKVRILNSHFTRTPSAPLPLCFSLSFVRHSIDYALTASPFHLLPVDKPIEKESSSSDSDLLNSQNLNEGTLSSSAQLVNGDFNSVFRFPITCEGDNLCGLVIDTVSFHVSSFSLIHLTNSPFVYHTPRHHIYRVYLYLYQV